MASVVFTRTLTVCTRCLRSGVVTKPAARAKQD